MKSTLKFVSVVLVLMLAVSAFAASAKSASATVRIPADVTVKGTKLAAGEYKVSLDGSGPEVKVTFAQEGQVKATVTGTLVAGNLAPEYSSVVTEKGAINELRLAKNKNTVKFE